MISFNIRDSFIKQPVKESRKTQRSGQEKIIRYPLSMCLDSRLQTAMNLASGNH